MSSRLRGSGLTPLEVAAGLAFGAPRRRGRRPRAGDPGTSAVEALEHAIAPALERPPCLVSFSGGRDSSVVLAAAVRLARRLGLPEPVPATNRFRRAPAADESDWQERVVAHLGLCDWHVVTHDDELEAVGPYATDALRRHGLLWPFNVHFHAPLLAAARGGSLLTGIGGDEAFARSRWERANDVLARRARPAPRDALRVALALAPVRLRAAHLRRSPTATLPWLTPAGNAAVQRAWAAQAASEPRDHAARLVWWRALRPTRLGVASLALLAADAGAEIRHPLAAARFGAALARELAGPPAREAALQRVFGPLLPEELYRRRTKAVFDEAFWGSAARGLARDWQGEGADPSLVGHEALRREWSRPVPDAHSFTLLQAAWLEREARGERRPAASPPDRASATSAGAATSGPEAPPAAGARRDRPAGA